MSPRQNTSGRGPWRKMLLLLLILPLSLLGGALALLIESQPLVAPLQAPTVDDALRTKRLVIRLLKGLESRQSTVEVHASVAELTSLLNLAGRGLPRLAGRVEISGQKVLLSHSLRLPPSRFSKVFNLQLELLPSKNGLNIGRARLGRINCPTPLALVLIQLTLDLGLGRGEGKTALDSLQSLQISGNRIHLQLANPSRLKSSLSRLPSRIAWLRDLSLLQTPSWPPEAGQFYLKCLMELSAQSPKGSTPQLRHYLGPLFALAQQRSVKGDPVAENQVALLALAGYLDDWRFAEVLNPAATETALKASHPPPRVLLAGRDDLRRHFVISAGLHLLAEQGLTAAIGEMKELLDSGPGGSGFSFADLAANRAGSALARSASDPKRARQLQRLLAASADEANFFPSLEGLPKDLSQQQFETRFGSLDSPAYLQLLQEIDRRLAQLPVHRQ